jgi:hypothetical protein
MNADELEDYLELQDPTFQRAITATNADIKAGRVRPAREPARRIGGSCHCRRLCGASQGIQ